MDITKKEKLVPAFSEDLEVHAKPIQNEGGELNNEPLSGAANIQRGKWKSMTLGRSPEMASSIESATGDRSKRLLKMLNPFAKKGTSNSSNGKKDTHKSQMPKLKEESVELNDLRKENEELKNRNTNLKEHVTELEKEIRKLKKDKKSLEKTNKDIRFSVEEALKNYDKTLANLDFCDFQCDEHFSVENLQIGTGNIQNISNIDTVALKRLLSQYHEQVKTIIKDWKHTKYNLQIAKQLQEQMGNQIISLKEAQSEVKEALLYARSIEKQDVSMDLLDYTISWTDPKLMAECVDELQNLPDKPVGYKFQDLKGKAKVGVLRVFLKYEKRTNYKSFVQRLEMEDIVSGEEKMAKDTPLGKDDCAFLLAKWEEWIQDVEEHHLF